MNIESQELHIQKFDSNTQESEEILESSLQSQSNENDINVMEIDDEDLHSSEKNNVIEILTEDDDTSSHENNAVFLFMK